MSFQESIKNCFQKYFDFNSRCIRSEYWYFTLFNFLISIIPYIAFYNNLDIAEIIIGFICLITFIPSLSVSYRRLHDINKSGWYLLLIFTIIGIIPLIIWCASKGNEESNKYGDNPLNIKK